MFVSTTSRLLLLLLVGMPLVVGCEYQSSAIQDRMNEFRYTPEMLANEMIGRLKHARLTPAKPRGPVVEADPGRGGDGDRPDPMAVDSIAADCVAKIQHMESLGHGEDVTSKVVKAVEDAKGVSESIRTEFVKHLQQASTHEMGD
ncbi:hypothetical protein AB1L30_13645 [Bremerella sp. JC817]|uniref:hypothetical protein n=1 Tax=Bremerella sp. JC817 TaxID=3231756 RepID=UPI003459FED9